MLQPIALTEALGCDRCQQIFVVEDSGRALEQLSTHYPYKRVWRWTGRRWTMTRSGLGASYLRIIASILLALLVFGAILALYPDHSIVVLGTFFAVLLALTLLPAFIIWLSYRR